MTDADILNKYGLPNLEELYVEFNKFEVEEEGIIFTILKKLHDKVDVYSKFLEDLIQPDSSLVSMQEASVFSEDEQKEIFKLFKQLTYFQRIFLKVGLNYTEEQKVDFFKKFYSFWLEKKSSIGQIADKAISIWNIKEEQVEFKGGYFG